MSLAEAFLNLKPISAQVLILQKKQQFRFCVRIRDGTIKTAEHLTWTSQNQKSFLIFGIL